MRHASLVSLAMLLTGASSLAAQGGPSPSWLRGCWRMTRGATVVEERWSDLQGGVLLGTSRTVRDGRAVEYEFSRITVEGDALDFHASPSGQTPATFRAISRTADSVVFANPQHDFPKLVVYKRVGADSLHAWVEGGSRRFNFHYGRIAC